MQDSLKSFSYYPSTDLKISNSTIHDAILKNTKPDQFEFNQTRMRLLVSSSEQKLSNPIRKEKRFNSKIQIKQNEFEKLDDIVPRWMLDRADFKDFYMKYDQYDKIDLQKVLNTPVFERNSFEKEALYSWVSNNKFFKKRSKNIKKQICEVLTCKTAKKDEKGRFYLVISAGSKADSMYIIYRGSVRIGLGNSELVQKKEGEVFGDIALKAKSTRKADVFSDSFNLVLFCISEEHYHKILDCDNSEKQKFCKILLQIPFFSKWSINRIRELSDSLSKNVFESKQVIYDFFQESQVFYILKSGKIEVQTMINIEHTNRWPVNSREWQTRKVITNYIYPIKTLEKCSFFGHYEIIKKSNRETRAVALEDSICLSLNKPDFYKFFKDADLAVLENLNGEYIPSGLEMEKTAREAISSVDQNKEILMEAMKIRYLPVDKDCLVDMRSKKLRKWMKCVEKRRWDEKKKVGERITRRVLKKDGGSGDLFPKIEGPRIGWMSPDIGKDKKKTVVSSSTRALSNNDREKVEKSALDDQIEKIFNAKRGSSVKS